jgi:DNA polymerase
MDPDLNNDRKRQKREELKKFYYLIKDCRDCDLHRTRINFVFGSGNSSAPIIFVGEAPGKNEDLQGKPFVGQAGRLLDELLATIGFKRDDVFIANVLKCRPPENRDPNINEINTCKKHLFSQIKIIDPMIICTLGRYSTQLLLDTSTGINKLRGKVFRISGRLIVPINHPAAALYTPSRMQVLKEDFKKVRDLLQNYQNPESITPVDDIHDGSQSKDDKYGMPEGGTGSKDQEVQESSDEKQLGLF